MNQSIVRRPLTVLLALLMVVSLFTVCGFGASAETIDLKLKTFTAEDLYSAAQKTGSINEEGMAIFTSFQEAVGRRSTAPGGIMIDGAEIHHSDADGNMNYVNGDTLEFVARVMAEDVYVSGDLVTIEFAFDATQGDTDHCHQFTIDYDLWNSVEERTDSDTGIYYKDFTFELTLDSDDYNISDKDDSLQNGQFRVYPLNDATVTIYGLSAYNKTTDKTIVEYTGDLIANMGSHQSSWENIYPDSNSISGIVTYYSNHQGILLSRDWQFDPYCFNAWGAAPDNPYILLENVGAELPAGVYAFDVEMATKYALQTTDKALIEIYDTETTDVLQSKVITESMVNSAAGKDTAKFATYRVSARVPEANAGHKIAARIYLYDSCDIWFRSITLYQPGVDTTMPEDAKAVQDKISALTAGDADAVKAARTALDALDFIGQAWVGEEAVEKLEMMEAAVAVSEQITALGSKDELTEQNYTEKTEALEAAEKSYNNFVKLYGRTEAEAQVTNYADLTAYREAYDAVKVNADKTAAIQKAVDAITAIGAVDEITKDNAAAKQELVDAAEAAVKELTDAYGEEILSSVTNYAAIADAKAKIAEVTSYTLGDVTGEGEINASDALMALQHSVKLTTLEDNDFAAADVDASEVVDATDALYILQYSVKLIDKFPAEQAAE